MKLSFCGYPIRISKEREAYVELKKKFDYLADALTEEFCDIYTKEYKNIDLVVKKAFQQGNIQIDKALMQAYNMLIQAGVYELDRGLFIEDYYNRYYDWNDCFNMVYDKYMDIVLTEEEKDAYRKARRENRGKWVGGGYGLGGAIKGSMQAGAMNMASGAVHGVFNLTAKGISAIGASMKKSKLYNDPRTRESLEDGVYRNISVIIYAFMEALSDYKDDNFDLVSTDDENRAQGLANNLLMIPDNKEKIVAEILSLDPFNEAVYECAITHNLDVHYELGKIGQYFDIDISDYVNMLISHTLTNIDMNNKKELQDSQEYILDVLSNYEIDTDDCPTLIEVNRNLERIDIEERTYNGILFSTLQIREKAEADHKEIDQICANCADMSKQELEETMEILEAGGYVNEIVTGYVVIVRKFYDTVEQRTLDNMIAKAEEDRDELSLLEEDVKKLDFDPERIANAETVIHNKIRAFDVASLDRLCEGMYSFSDKQYHEVCEQIGRFNCDQDLKGYYLEKLNYLNNFSILDSFSEDELQNLYEKINKLIPDDKKKEYAEKIEQVYYNRIRGNIGPYLSELESLSFQLGQDLFFVGKKAKGDQINESFISSAASKHMMACGHPNYYRVPLIASVKYFGVTADTLFIKKYDTYEEIKLDEVDKFAFEKHLLLSKLNITLRDGSMKSIDSCFPKKMADSYIQVLNLILVMFGNRNKVENLNTDKFSDEKIQKRPNEIRNNDTEGSPDHAYLLNLDDIVRSVREKYYNDPDTKKCTFFSFRGMDDFDKKVEKVLSVIMLNDPNNELPIFVYDNTLFESGKAGTLITDKNVYAIKLRKFIALEKVRCVSTETGVLCFETKEGKFKTKCDTLGEHARNMLAKYLSELIDDINGNAVDDKKQVVPLDAIFCPRCKQKLSLDSNFCSRCGQKIC